MAARGAALVLLLTLASGAVLTSRAADQQTALDKYFAAGAAAEHAGHYVEAKVQYAAAVAEARQSDPRRIGLALNHLANCYFLSGDETRAFELMKQAREADVQFLGPTDRRSINDLGNQAFFYSTHNQDAEAEKLFKQVLELADQNASVTKYQKGNWLTNLCDLYMRQKRYAECEPLLQQTIELFGDSPQPWDAQQVVGLRRRLADAYRKEGNEREAQEIENQVYEGVRRNKDPNLDFIQTTLDQADDSRARENLVAAEDGYREVIAATENHGGLMYDSILSSALFGLGMVCAAEERDEEAESLFLRAFDVHERNVMEGNRNSARVTYLAPLLNLYQKQGRLADIEPLCERALALQEQVLGPDDKAVAQTLRLYADVYVQEEKYQEALPLLARAVNIQEKTLGPSSQLASTLERYADVLDGLGEKEEAEAARARANAIHKQIAPPTRESRSNP